MKHLVPVCACLMVALFAALYGIDRPFYLHALSSIHEQPFDPPFLDTRFVSAQAQCWAMGVDVYARNPCDPLGRTQDYSPLWLRLPLLAQPASATPWLGGVVVGLFLVSLFGLPWEPADRRGRLLNVLGVCSWTTIFAAERGNTDLLMFAAAVLAARLLDGRRAGARVAGHAVALCAGLLKFYPLVLLAALLRESGRLLLLAGTTASVALLCFAWGFHAELSRIGANMATGYLGHMFGARSLPFGSMQMLAERGRLPGGWRRPLSAALLLLLCVGCSGIALRRARDPALREALLRLRPRSRTSLLCGALLVVGCFFAHQSIGYRAVLLLLALPGLGALRRAAPAGRTAARLDPTDLLVVCVLWSGTLSRKPIVWLAASLCWWWIVTVLGSIALCLLLPEVPRLLRRPRRALFFATRASGARCPAVEHANKENADGSGGPGFLQ